MWWAGLRQFVSDALHLTSSPFGSYGTGGWYGSVYTDNVTFGSGSSSSIVIDSMNFVAETENLCSGGVYNWYSSTSTPPVAQGIAGLAYYALTDSSPAVRTCLQAYLLRLLL